MTTKSIRKEDVSRTWWLIDASSLTLGRLSTQIANKLIGKSKPDYTPHVDNGDFVIVINSDKLVYKGQEDDKVYYRHSGYPGGIKATSLSELRNKNSTKVIQSAVKGMLPKNKLQDKRMKRLKVYKDDNHNHAAQKPVMIEEAS